jgi:uncharacterized membrane protein
MQIERRRAIAPARLDGSPRIGRNITVAVPLAPSRRTPIHPLHAFLVAAATPLFLGGLLSDLAYSSNYHEQWNNFAMWLIAGAMVFTGFALLWSLIDLVRTRGRGVSPMAIFVLLLAAFVLGLINSFVHARDAYGTMPGGLILSLIVTLIIAVGTWLAFATFRPGETK